MSKELRPDSFPVQSYARSVQGVLITLWEGTSTYGRMMNSRSTEYQVWRIFGATGLRRGRDTEKFQSRGAGFSIVALSV